MPATTPATTRKRLPKAERRDQLLETARAIVREQGTDGLTLGYVAERAGVTKPIAYEHFGSRAGLLIALYERIHDHHVAALLAALADAPRRLEDVARVVGDAYMSCYTSEGQDWHAISAALQGDERMEAFQQELVDEYVALYRDALAPYTELSRKELHLRCVGIVGAGEAISLEMLRGRVGEAVAAATLSSLIVSWLREDAAGD